MNWVYVLLIALGLARCASRAPNQLNPEELAVAAKNAETPAGVSTIEFKELGNAKRANLMEKFIRSTWDEACKPEKVANSGYLPNGGSKWNISCLGSSLAYDYLVTLPERATNNARVLKCFRFGHTLVCDLVGRPPGE
jgi:hypothetical protein